MPWKDVTIVSQRYEFVRLYLDGTSSMTTLCRRFGVARKTAYKWVARYRAGGAEALMDQSRRPSTSPHQTPPDLAAQVLALAEEHPTWGGKKLHFALRDDGMDPLPAPSTITKILRRAGRSTAVLPLRAGGAQRTVADGLQGLARHARRQGPPAVGAGRSQPLPAGVARHRGPGPRGDSARPDGVFPHLRPAVGTPGR